LAKIARLTNERWADVEPSLREFFHDNGDEWVHLRIEEDLASVREKLTKKSAAGKASVQARRSRKEADVQTKQERDLTGVQTNVGVVFEHDANTKATNKDTDKELNPTHNARARESAPTSEPNGTPSQATEPGYLDGMSEPIGKFPMADGWHPSLDFRRRAALWGAALPEPEFTPAELAAFRDYWMAEGKVFTQVQWEQKFARHVNHVRAQVKPVSKGVNHAAAPGGTASRAVQEIRAAREQWERENGFISDGNSLEAVGTHGGGLFGPLDPEERGRTFEALDCTDWRDD
ncbi:TPA: DnaT-like ssDNA-binding domain-containing protein, partial [Escherichia coli]